MIYLTLTKLFSSSLSWKAKEGGSAEKEITKILQHFFTQYNETVIQKSGRESQKCLGTNKKGENRKYEDNLENLNSCRGIDKGYMKNKQHPWFWKF